MSIALLIIDVQKQYVEMSDFKKSFAEAREYINEVSKYFRNATLPVIHIQHISKTEDQKKEELQVSDEIVQNETDNYVIKSYSNAFWKTNLEELLKEKDVDFVICCGLAASQCVHSTYMGAIERDFKVVMLQNGLIDRTIKLENWIYNTHNVISYNSIKYLLDNIKDN